MEVDLRGMSVGEGGLLWWGLEGRDEVWEGDVERVERGGGGGVNEEEGGPGDGTDVGMQD